MSVSEETLTSAKPKKVPAKKAPAKKAPAKKAAAKPKAKAVKATNGSGKRGPKGNFALDDKIKVLVTENPFRRGTKSEGWFANYKPGMTVADAIAVGTPRHHIRRDQTLGNIKIG